MKEKETYIHNKKYYWVHVLGRYYLEGLGAVVVYKKLDGLRKVMFQGPFEDKFHKFTPTKKKDLEHAKN
jgi:hypothetical protein